MLAADLTGFMGSSTRLSPERMCHFQDPAGRRTRMTHPTLSITTRPSTATAVRVRHRVTSPPWRHVPPAHISSDTPISSTP